MAEERRPFGHVYQRPGRRGWYIRVRRLGHPILRRYAGPNRRHAEDLLRRMEGAWFSAIATGKPPVLLSETTLAEFRPEYERILTSRVTPAALLVAKGHLAIASERMTGPMARIGAPALGEFLAWLRVKRAAKEGTCNRYLATLSGCFRAAKERGIIPENPCLEVRRLKVQERPVPFLSDADCAALEARAPRSVRPLLVLASETGMRLGELGRLQWRDLDLGRRQVTVRESKARRVRVVDLTARAVAAMTSVPRGPVKMRGENPVFPGAYARRRQMQREIARRADAAGLPRVTFHWLRHGWACRLTASGVDPLVLMRLGGWASLAMLTRYAHHRPEGAGRAAADLVDRQRERRRGTTRGTKSRKSA